MYAGEVRNRRLGRRRDDDHVRMDVSADGTHNAIPHTFALAPTTLPSNKRSNVLMVQRTVSGEGEPPAKRTARLPRRIDSRSQRNKISSKSTVLRKKTWSSNCDAKSFSASSMSARGDDNERHRITHFSTGSVMGKSAAVLAGKRLLSDKPVSRRNDEAVHKQERRQLKQWQDSTGPKHANYSQKDDTILLARKRVQPTFVSDPETIRTKPTTEPGVDVVCAAISITKRIRTEVVPVAQPEPEDDRPLTPSRQIPNDAVATLEDLKSHCWTCKSRVQQVDGHESFYAMHVHPILKVPCCILCCEAVEAMEVPDDQDDLEQCCACVMDDGDDLLLCDVCPSGFCTTCVAQAWGGGRSGLQLVQQLASDNSRSWACIRCNPPSALRSLQISDQEESTETNDDNNEDESAVMEIVSKLDAVEDDLDYCDHLMEEDNVLQLEGEIRAELAESFHCQKELEKVVAWEITLWKEKHMEHATRVQDYKVDLLERLNKHGFSDDQYYNYRAERKPKQVDDYESDWRRKADAEIQKRLHDEDKAEAEHRKSKRQQMLENEDDSDDSVAEEKVALAEVEDLCNDSTYEEWETEEVLEFRKKWNRCEFESREDREKKQNRYLARDDVYLKSVGARITKVDKDTDAESTRREFAFVSFKSSAGVSIRRDAILAMRQNATNQKRSLSFRRKGETRVNRSSTSPHGADDIRSITQVKAKSIASSPRNQEGLSSSTSTPSRVRCGDSNQKIESAPVVECMPFIGDAFWDSCVELCSDDEGNGTRTVRLASALASKLKPHQVDGVKFMWQNSCKDLSMISTREEALEERGIGGCILAHLMGLGKTLQVITLVHTLLHHPELRPPGNSDANSFVRKILLIVPVNTIVNWTNEFEKWTGGLKHSVRYFDYSSVQTSNRQKMVQNWTETGGVLLIGADAFVRLVKKEKDTKLFHDPGPDMVIVDEAHSLVRNQSSEFAKVLGPIRTKRRITLTGTPFVNNLKEYFKLADWCRPGTLGTFANFDKTYAQKIMAGLASDSTTHQVAQQVRTSMMLANKMAPFMQRRGVAFLTRDLPPSQTVVLYIRQSKLQTRLYRSFEKYAKGLQGSNKLSFIAHYQMLRPLHNHPTCLLEQAKAKSINKIIAVKQKEKKGVLAASVKVRAEQKGHKQQGNSKEIVDLTEVLNEHMEGESGWNNSLGIVQESLPGGDRKDMEYSWMDRILAKTNETAFTSVKNGYKIFLLLQILANANCLGDKVVVFSQCLKTLDFIETVLNTHDWARFCKGFENDNTLGSWKKGVDYLRIDGSVNASTRGDLVSSFHQTVGGVKVFLLSIEAGGIGINLTAANRVVIFDNHWVSSFAPMKVSNPKDSPILQNPTVSSQAFHRCYRYGQEKPVFGYRFITQGSMEEKIYKRSMKKSGIAARVVDQQFPERNFTDREMAEIQSIDNWVQCDRCNKWRILFFKNEEDLPDKWYCEMNNDPLNNECAAKERCGDWYEKNRKRIEEMIEKDLGGKNAVSPEGLDSENIERPETATKDLVQTDNVQNRTEATKKDLVQKDSILVAMGLLDFFDVANQDSAKGTPISVISDIQFQELLQTESADLAIEASHAEAELALASEEAASVVEVSSISDNQTFQSMQEPHPSIEPETMRATHRLTDPIATDTHKQQVHDEGTKTTPIAASDLGCEELPSVMSILIPEQQQPNQRIDPKDGLSDDAPKAMVLPEPTNPRCPQAIGPPRNIAHRSTSTGKSIQDAIEVRDDSEDEMDMGLFYEIARTLF